jgi:hypothetical protein
MSKANPKRKSKPCTLCSQDADIRYRIQYQKNAQCWQKVSQDNPFYRYGGTWKAR